MMKARYPTALWLAMLSSQVVRLTFGFAVSPAPASSTRAVDNSFPTDPIGTAVVDYSTATEFIREHYQIPNYFGFDEEVRRETAVYDIRNGVLCYDEQTTNTPPRVTTTRPAALDDCGFQVLKAPTQVLNFEDLQEIQRHYVHELEELLPRALCLEKEQVEQLILWHPTLRGEEITVGPRLKDRPGLGPIAGRAHIDTDVGAYGLEGVCNLVDKNRVTALDDDGTNSIKDDLIKLCVDGHRMILLNIWRPLVPVTSAPLGVYATRYDRSLPQEEAIFPKVAPDRATSQWYIASHMQPDECLIFKQYDRRIDKMSDIWHCALNVQGNNQQDDNDNDSQPRAPRKSFDIKAMVVLKEKVSPEMDRLSKAARPIMTWEESAQFCQEQSSRQGETKSQD